MKTKLPYFPLIVVASALAVTTATQTMDARKIRTKHSIPRTSAKETDSYSSAPTRTVSIETDSIVFCDSILPAVRFYGFDKPVSSNTESFFISNGISQSLSRLEVEITYTDIKGRQLHKRKVSIDCDIPAGETKRVDIKSWDTQKSFYFHKSVKPKRQATPFDIKIKLVSASLSQNAKRKT